MPNNLFSSSERLKINHITMAKYAFILEKGAVAKNSGTVGFIIQCGSIGKSEINVKQ
jgi:hypothetical protein